MARGSVELFCLYLQNTLVHVDLRCLSPETYRFSQTAVWPLSKKNDTKLISSSHIFLAHRSTLGTVEGSFVMSVTPPISIYTLVDFFMTAASYPDELACGKKNSLKLSHFLSWRLTNFLIPFLQIWTTWDDPLNSMSAWSWRFKFPYEIRQMFLFYQSHLILEFNMYDNWTSQRDLFHYRTSP